MDGATPRVRAVYFFKTRKEDILVVIQEDLIKQSQDFDKINSSYRGEVSIGAQIKY